MPQIPLEKDPIDGCLRYRSGGADREIFGSDEVMESFIKAARACNFNVVAFLFQTKRDGDFLSVDPLRYGTPDELHLDNHTISFLYFS